MQEVITYLVANYNQEPYLGDCIGSLYAQTSEHWRCIIVDDASTDDSVDVIQSLVQDDRVQLFQHKSNQGLNRTQQALISKVSTGIVAILDPDDALAPHTTETLLRAFASSPSIGFVYSKCGCYDETLTRKYYTLGEPIPNGCTSLQFGWIGAIRAFRVEEYRKTEGYDLSMDYAEDRDLVMKLEEVSRPLFLNEELYYHRILPSSQSHDPAKVYTGLVNHRRALVGALKRRKITGFGRLCYLGLFALHVWSWNPYIPSVFRFPVRVLYRGLLFLDKFLKLRPVGELRYE